jgi:hypothetical protein
VSSSCRRSSMEQGETSGTRRTDNQSVPVKSGLTLGAMHRHAYAQRLDKDCLWLKARENDVRRNQFKVCICCFRVLNPTNFVVGANNKKTHGCIFAG